MLAYVYDFVSYLMEDAGIRKGVRKIVLFGSAASGEYDEKSDIDIFIDAWGSDSRMEARIKERVRKFEEIMSRKWAPKGIANPISVVVGQLDSGKWKKLEYDMISNGILLYGKFEKKPGSLEHMVLMSFSLVRLEQAKKMRLIRRLYGNSQKSGSHEGAVWKAGGTKISSNTILVPVEKSNEVRKILSSFRVTPEIREVWSIK